jgi:cytochrome c biogenesis protein CcmG, thiol:disulfide interchange protein DsbE
MADVNPMGGLTQPSAPQSHWTLLTGLIAVVVGLWLFWLVLNWVVTPLLRPHRFGPLPENHAGVGEPLTIVELEPLTGSEAPLSASDLQGKVVLLNFWGTWCPPCRDELPSMAGLRQRFAGHEAFRLLAISYPAGGQGNDLVSLREETAALLKRLDLDLPTYCDPDDKTRAAVDQLIRFEGFPTSVLLDRRGVIRAVWVGYWPGAETEMEHFIDKLLSEKP